MKIIFVIIAILLLTSCANMSASLEDCKRYGCLVLIPQE